MLLTLKQRDQAILLNQEVASWFWATATIEGRVQTRASVLGMEERRKKRMAAAFLCCQAYHRRFLARTNSDSTKSLSVLGLNQQ
jgi:hypothetical protein